MNSYTGHRPCRSFLSGTRYRIGQRNTLRGIVCGPICGTAAAVLVGRYIGGSRFRGRLRRRRKKLHGREAIRGTSLSVDSSKIPGLLIHALCIFLPVVFSEYFYIQTVPASQNFLKLLFAFFNSDIKKFVSSLSV